VGGQISGLYRVRFAGGPLSIPQDVRSAQQGILLRFHEPLAENIAVDRSNYTIDRWNYRQTHNYGSGNYRLDGQPGQETVPVSQAYLSQDKRTVFLAIPDMQPVHSMRVSYRSALPFEQPTIQHAYLTVHVLNPMNLKAEGFGDLVPDMEAVKDDGAVEKTPEPTVALGKELYQQFGCVGCHSVDGSKIKAGTTLVQVGPTWKGLFGSRRELSDGTTIRNVDEAYLRESIVDPGARVPKGFNMTETGVGMPSYLGVLKDHQIDSLILYIKSL
jgi:mono/diheme cytochrome c family protein